MKRNKYIVILTSLMFSFFTFKVKESNKTFSKNISQLKYINKDFEGVNKYKIYNIKDADFDKFYYCKLYENDIYKGYAIFDENYEFVISKSDTEDDFKDMSNSYYFNSPFDLSLNKKVPVKKIKYRENKIKKLKYGGYEHNLPYIESDNLRIQSSTYNNFIYLTGVPEYYNSPEKYNVFKNGGCTPTAVLMMMSYYDRNCAYFSDLYEPNLPLKHDEDINRVNSSIKEVGKQLGTSEENGDTYTDLIAGGINKFLLNNYKDVYMANRIYNINVNNICELGLKLIQEKNVAHLSIGYFNENNVLIPNHSVVLTGYNNVKSLGVIFKVNYGWESRSTYDLSPKYVYDLTYLYQFK